MKMENTENIWNKKFDGIYCLSYIPYKNRRLSLERELKRTGILSSGIFKYHYTFETQLDDTLLLSDNFTYDRNNARFVKSTLNLAIGHYSIMKEALGLGMKRILIIEDDIRFMKDTGKINDILSAMPMDSDLILFDKIGLQSQQREFEMQKEHPVNNYFSWMGSLILWGCSCYSVNKKAMEHITEMQERKFNVADFYTNDFNIFGQRVYDGIKRSFALENIAVQIPNEITATDHDSGSSPYTQRGLTSFGIDMGKYNV